MIDLLQIQIMRESVLLAMINNEAGREALKVKPKDKFKVYDKYMPQLNALAASINAKKAMKKTVLSTAINKSLN